MTVGELDKQLTALIGKKYLQHPEVNVAVEKYNNMQVYIVGHVQKPGLYKLTGPTTLLELISLAGDFTEGAGSTITVARAKAHEVFQGGKSKLVYEEEPIVIDVKKLLVEGDLTLNINLMNDDKIYVPGKSLSGQVFVFGEVNRPGYYSYRPDMTVFDAINTAGGFTEYAKKSGVVIKRSEGERGESTSIKVNMKALLKKGRIEKNVTLQPGDIIVVPSSFLF
jgi:polysaccharide export outer membrane protein